MHDVRDVPAVSAALEERSSLGCRASWVVDAEEGQVTSTSRSICHPAALCS
jgi:hypothetical protein